MEIKKHVFSVKQIAEGYVNNQEEGCSTLNGRLNIRPAYQREFVYKDEQRNAVMDTIRKGFPLNTMYWVRTADNDVKDDDLTGTYEILDGQQRTISFCEYVAGKYSILYDQGKDDTRYYFSLSDEEKKKIDDYKIDVYICEGSEDEKMAWFERINLAGEPLSKQEIRNAFHTGTWLYEAKKHFSKNGCRCQKEYSHLMSGKMIRQEWLEKALYWISENQHVTINDYMSMHQNDEDDSELWQYFTNVMAWVSNLFLNSDTKLSYAGAMSGIEWGLLYNKYHKNDYNYKEIIDKTDKLYKDPYVKNKSGIFEFVLTDRFIENYRLLNIRCFDDVAKQTAYNKQNGICPDCKLQENDRHYDISEMEADHVTAWSKGGATDINNCQMLCIHHNRLKGNK